VGGRIYDVCFFTMHTKSIALGGCCSHRHLDLHAKTFQDGRVIKPLFEFVHVNNGRPGEDTCKPHGESRMGRIAAIGVLSSAGTEFEKVWKGLRDDLAGKAAYVRILEPDNLETVFKNAIDGSTLATLTTAALHDVVFSTTWKPPSCPQENKGA